MYNRALQPISMNVRGNHRSFTGCRFF